MPAVGHRPEPTATWRPRPMRQSFGMAQAMGCTFIRGRCSTANQAFLWVFEHRGRRCGQQP
jgi:hypothetical protein